MDAGQNDRAPLRDDAAADAGAVQARALLDAVQATLRLATALAQMQRPVDLAGLERGVGRLCAACLDLPPDHGRALRPSLLGLLGELDALQEMLRAAGPVQ